MTAGEMLDLFESSLGTLNHSEPADDCSDRAPRHWGVFHQAEEMREHWTETSVRTQSSSAAREGHMETLKPAPPRTSVLNTGPGQRRQTRKD